MTVYDKKGEVVDSKYYDVHYYANWHVGTARASVKFKTGSAAKYDLSTNMEANYEIKPAATSLTSVKAGKKSLTVKWKKQATGHPYSKIDGYRISYSTSKDMKNAKTVKVKTYSKTGTTISKLKSKKTYYVRVQTYMKRGNTNYYSVWSPIKKVKTR